MTTTGTADFNPTVQQIVTSSLRKCGVIMEDETPTAGQYADAVFQLNAMVKGWQATGLHVWTECEGILFPQPGQARYLLGTGSTDASSLVPGYTLTTTSVAAAPGASAVTLTSASGVSNGQAIGILLSTGSMQWTTISSLVGSTANLAAVLTASVNAGANVATYTTRLQRPLKIPEARLLYLNGLNEIPIDVVSRQEYMDQPNKTVPGTPTQVFYAPLLGAGEFYVWPVPVQAIYAIRFTWYRSLDDLINASDTVDFPQEWINPLIWALAEEIGPEYDLPPARWQIITAKAQAAREMAENWDRESEPVLFGVSWDGR